MDEGRTRPGGVSSHDVVVQAAHALRDRCRHWCGCINHAQTGDVGGVDGLLCWVEQRRIEVADRAAEILYGEANPGFPWRFCA